MTMGTTTSVSTTIDKHANALAVPSITTNYRPFDNT